MAGWEYKVVPAPSKGVKARGIKGPEERFAHALETLMNEMGADGWEFQRSETLPSIERSGLTGSTTEWRNVMVFRRAAAAPMDAFEPELLPAPAPVPTEVETPTEPVAEMPESQADDATSEAPNAAETDVTAAQEDDGFIPGTGATQMLPDNGVEETSEVSGMTASLKNLVKQRKVKDSAS